MACRRWSRLLFILLGCLTLSPTFANSLINLTKGVSDVSLEIYNLHMLAFWVCVGIGVVVFGVLSYALIFHRKKRGHKAADFHEHTTIEILWAVIPLLILVILAIPATLVLMKMHDTKHSELTVKVTGYQWKWRYDYLDQKVGYFSNLSTPYDEIYGNAKKNPNYLLQVDKPLILPTHRKVRFLITSNDVIHSWWVPDLGFKKDAVPGFIHESWTVINKPGIYRGQCAELCGVNHAFMPIVVVAIPPEEFDTWLQQQEGKKAINITMPEVQTADKPTLMKQGKDIYHRYCASCHGDQGQGKPPFYPALAQAYTMPLEDQLNIVIHGKAAMPGFTQWLSPEELSAVVTYQNNAWNNDAGQMVTTKQVKEVIAKAPMPATDSTTESATADIEKLEEEKKSEQQAQTTAAAPDKAQLMKQGKEVYMQYCSVCHQPDGKGNPPVFPALVGSPMITGPIDKHIDIVLNGKAGTTMQAFKDQLSAEDIAAVITYERNAWNDNKGDVVTAEDVKKAQGG